MAAFYLCIVVAAIGASEFKEGPDADHSNNVTSLRSWSVNRLLARYDVLSLVETAPTALVGEIGVVPTREPTSVAVPTTVPTVELSPSAVVCAYPWDCATAIRIVSCETGGTFNPNAVGSSGERGWFQIASVHWGRPQCNPDRLFDPIYNTACAYSIWTEQGWWPWSCY